MILNCKKCGKQKQRMMVLQRTNNGKPLNPIWMICRSCNTKRTISEKTRLSLNRANQKSYIKNKEKFITRLKTRYYIKKGIIKKPLRCEVCEKKCSGHALQAHHEDYSKPLEVIFLCYSCHADADKLLEVTPSPHK